MISNDLIKFQKKGIQSSTPLVSIIVPIYNVEKYLDRCLNTLLNQSLKNIEIILVDDESPDNCPNLCEKYKQIDKRVKVVHKKNEGLGFARNSGLEVATGEYVAFLDSDDFVDTEMYKTLYDYAKKFDADTVFCNNCFYKDNGEIIYRKDFNKVTVLNTPVENKEFLLDMVGPMPNFKSDVKYMMSVWRAIYKRSNLIKYEIKFNSERLVVSEDIVFHIDYLSKIKRSVLIPFNYYFYCYNGTSLTKTYYDGKYDKIKEFLTLLDIMLKKIFVESEYKIRLNRLSFLYLRYILKNEEKISKSFMESKNRIRKVLSDNFWIKIISTYPINKLPFKHKLFMYLLKWKMSYLVTILMKIINK